MGYKSIKSEKVKDEEEYFDFWREVAVEDKRRTTNISFMAGVERFLWGKSPSGGRDRVARLST
jgi:hypothetical protein